MIALLANRSSLNVQTRFKAESFALNLAERASTATIVLGPEAPEIEMGDWLLDEDEPGAGIVWRVKSVDIQYDTNTRTLQLEHLINKLRDGLLFGEITPATITGDSTATECTARQAIEYILDGQGSWVLGTCEYDVSNPYSFNGENRYSALETVCTSLDDCWWSYDMSSYPFVLNITQRARAVSTELRMSRNIQSARMTIDRSRMFTRIYPIGKNNLHIDGNYLERNTDLYGVIAKTETDQSKETKGELRRWALERLKRHSHPTVTGTVTALDLSKGTGESLDHIVLGAMCRMPLPGYNTTIEEIITKISYPNKLLEPDRATVTMANVREDVATIINNLIKSTGGGGRTAAKNAEEDHAWFVDTTNHVAMIAEAVAGEGADQDWSRVAEVLVDGDGIHQRVTQTENDIVTAYSLIDQTSTAIRLEIGTVASEVRSFIEQTPEMIHAEVGYAVSGLAHSVIEQTATYIRTTVENAASEITATVVEQTTEYIRSEVSAVASGVAWSVINQTMSDIMLQIHRKSKVYIQLTDPNDGTNVLYDGDIWIKADPEKTWEENANNTWDSQSGKKWRSKYGDLIYVWRNGAWVLTKDTSVDVENEVTINQTKDAVDITAQRIDAAGNTFNANLEVTANHIRTDVSTANSRIYSTIEQTATNIRSMVVDEVNGLQSSIEQTASQITTSVSAANSALYSTIVQTATQIRSEVGNTLSNVYSRITQEANKISLLVEGTGANAHIKPAEIVAAINNGESTIKLSASHIDIDGLVNLLRAKAVTVHSLDVSGAIDAQDIDCSYIDCEGINTNTGNVICGGKVDTDTLVAETLKVYDGNTLRTASWKSKSVITAVERGNSRNFVYARNGNIDDLQTMIGTLVTGTTSTTIYYLGRG